MHFAFTDDQIAITEAARDFLISTTDSRELRRIQQNDRAVDQNRWETILDLGYLSLLGPEAAGGLGLSLIDLIGVAEAAGYVALPEPLIEQAGVAIPLLAELRDARGWLERAIAGEIVAVGHPANPFVADADSAAALLLDHQGEVHLVERGAVTLTRVESFDPLRRLFHVDWTPSPATHVGEWGRTAERGMVLAAAQLIGLGQRCIDMAVAYAKDRQQFGKPIGSYQAIKHLVATAQVAIEFARPVVQAAAAELPLGNLASQARAAHAKLAAAQAADLAARTAVQVHGAMGMTWEVDVHFFLKRVLALKTAWGTPAGHTATVIERLTAAPTGPDMTFASEVARSLG